MLKKNLNLLMALGLIQILIIASVYYFKNTKPSGPVENKFIQLGLDSLTKIVIEDLEKITVTLEKNNGIWVLPDYWNFPASPSKIAEITSDLNNLKVSTPVGKTMIAAKQLMVSEDNFEKRLDYYVGDKKVNTLFLGTAPSFKKANARVDGSQNTYVADINTVEISAKYNVWFDREKIKHKKEDIKELHWNDLTLENVNGNFVVKDLPSGKDLEAQKMDSLLKIVCDMEYIDVLGPDLDMSKDEKVAFTLKMDLLKGESLTYNFYQIHNDPKESEKSDASKPQDYGLKISNDPFLYKIPGQAVDFLKGINKEKLNKS